MNVVKETARHAKLGFAVLHTGKPESVPHIHFTLANSKKDIVEHLPNTAARAVNQSLEAAQAVSTARDISCVAM